MKILMVNKFHYIKGGSETYYFSLKQLLEEKGHEVIDFSMKDSKNHPSIYEPYFVDSVDYNKKQGLVEKAKIGVKLIYSKEAKQKFEQLVKDTKPDLVHLHIFQHQISLSILDVCKKYHLPVVYTAHDLKMLCPNYRMYAKDGVCERCKNGKYLECFKNKCLKDSSLKSGIAVLEAKINQWRKSYDIIDHIVTPSEFFEKKFIDWGIRSERVTYVPNFLIEDTVSYEKTDENYFLYFGRLSEEKGIGTLLKAMKTVKTPLKVVGTGPMTEQLKQFAKQENLDHVFFLGFRSGQELTDLVGNAKAVILPSEWYENGPYSAIEALRLARPLIGSDLGGIPELIEEGTNGFIFPHGKVEALADCLCKMEQLSKEKYKKMEVAARKLFLKKYTKEVHYANLMAIYKDALNH